MDTQDGRPDVEQNLQRVGITNLKTLIETKWKGKRFRFAPEIEITIDLPKDKKGVHMSRLIESITESVEEETQKQGTSIEAIEKKVLDNLSKKHRYRRGEIRMTLDFFVERKTPATRKQTLEAHRACVAVARDGEKYAKTLKVTVLGNTTCPHAIKTCGRPHIQRAIGELTVEAEYASRINLEDMISVVEGAFSSPVYTLLKTSDEMKVIEGMYANPKFVEDVVRGILLAAGKKFKNCRITAKAISQESIHRHDVIAEGTIAA
jgi:GTP cyclohydrolase-4